MNRDELFLYLNYLIEKEKILWIQGPGGNTSFKEGAQLFVKASGTRIRDLKNTNQLSTLHFQSLLNSLSTLNKGFNPRNPGENEQSILNSEVRYKEALELSTVANSPRPSMESGFHAELSKTFVLHFHSLSAIVMAEYASIENNRSHFNKWFDDHWKNKLGFLQIIDFCLPGYQLTKEIAKKSSSSIFLLKNHGVVLAFDRPDFLETYQSFEQRALEQFLPQSWSLIQKWQGLNTQSLVEQFPELLEAHSHCYFPDMAIFWPRIQKRISKTSSGTFIYNLWEHFDQNWSSLIKNPRDFHQWISKSWNNDVVDLDALENWLAGSMLQKLFPDLPQLPQSLCDKIVSLPTEIARKQTMESH